MKHWTPETVASAAGATLQTGSTVTAGPERVTIDSRAVGPGALFVGLPGANVDGGRFAAAALEAGAWGVLVTPAHAEPLAQRRGCHRRGPRRRRPPEIPAKPGHGLAPRTGRAGHRRHRLDGQDVDQGPAPGRSRTAQARRRVAGQLQHRDRDAAGDPQRAGGHGDPGAGDGHARGGTDRRAGRDRRARRRRDREHRAGPSRADGHDRGDRRGQGGADRRAGTRGHRRRPGERAAVGTASEK